MRSKPELVSLIFFQILFRTTNNHPALRGRTNSILMTVSCQTHSNTKHTYINTLQMNLAQPARPASPALAATALSTVPVENDSEYIVEPAQGSADPLNVAPAQVTEAATMVGDPRDHAPKEAMKEPWR